MPTLPNMVDAFAATDGRERKTIEHIARVIRDHGYIQTGKRGAGAPHMNPTDAANLLIALCGCETAGEAPLAIDRFRSLVPMIDGNADSISEYVDNISRLPEPLRDAMNCRTFGTALEAVIAGADHLMSALRQYLGEQYKLTDRDKNLNSMLRLNLAGVEIEFRRYSAAIRLYRTAGRDKDCDFEAIFVVDMKRPPSFYGIDQATPDRKVSVKVGILTLMQAHSVVTQVDV